MLGDLELKEKALSVYHQVDRWSGGMLSALKEAVESFQKAKAQHAAAGLAYYVFFSLFPLLLFLVAVSSRVLRGENAFDEAVNFVQQAIPMSGNLIEKNLHTVLNLRGTVGVVGMVGALWAASRAFVVLAANINRAWHTAESRGFVKQRLIAIAMIGVLLILLLLSLSSTTIARLLPTLEIPINGGISLYETFLWRVSTRLLPLGFTFLMFLALYRWVPNTEVHWKSAIYGALFAALGWELAKAGFAWYLSSGLARYELVYGSLGTVVALLFWLYISGIVTFFGAHFSAALDHDRTPARQVAQ